MSKTNNKPIPLADEDFDFEEHLLSISEISSLSSSSDSLSPPPPTIPMRKISLIERRGLQIEGLKIAEKGYTLISDTEVNILLKSVHSLNKENFKSIFN